MCAVGDDQSVVGDREPDEEKGLDSSGPRIRLLVQNREPDTSVIRTSDLEVDGMPGTYENLQPTRRNYVQARAR